MSMPPARSCVVLRRGVLRGDTARSRGPLTAVQTEALAGQRCGMVTGTADETGAIRDEFGSAGPSQRWKPGRSSRFSGQYRLCHRQATGRGTSMITPATTLDHRYSAPGAVATGWDETRIVLETAELFWISTVRADGRPHVTPLVAVWADGALHFSTGAEADDCCGNRASADCTRSRSLRSEGAVTPPNDAITLPRGSVTRNSPADVEIRDHNSLALSRMVAWSRVPKAARTSDMPASRRLTEFNSPVRASHREA